MIRKYLLLAMLATSMGVATAQTETSGREKVYHAEATKYNALDHTKLRVSFSLEKRELYGEEWLTAAPYFYPTDSLVLDAQAMLIHSVNLCDKKGNIGRSLSYKYANDKLTIQLDKTYQRGEKYTVYIKYTSQPEKVGKEGSQAINDAKGLFFINPTKEDKNRPIEIWTQGETRSNSTWFPTIDETNQKSSQEIYITVPERFITLSNGVLTSSKKDGKGQRTDYWVFKQKHAPYLFFLGAGEYAQIKDKPWRGKVPLTYYVEHEYADVAKRIFGKTGEMMEFFSTLLNCDYPWPTYDQITAQEYVSGAMENTTATLHSSMAQQTAESLNDENKWESVVAHELFHHWFGDLVTAESWANLTVNESFANYSEYLWLEHKYGKDYADYHLGRDISGYKNSGSYHKHLVRFDYEKADDMFDAVSYNKGGGILHMLRNYLGDKAFFEGMSKYLKDNKFGTGEAHQLRLAFEAVSGRDLNWFFNQWYFNYGNVVMTPKITYDSAKGEAVLEIGQDEKLPFQFPLEVDIYDGGKYERKEVWVSAKPKNEFRFKVSPNYSLIDVDPRGLIVGDEAPYKTAEQYLFQYNRANDYKSRNQAVEYAITNNNSEILIAALRDPFFRLRIKAIQGLRQSNANQWAPIVENLANNDPENLVKAAAITQLSYLRDARYKSLFENAVKIPSRSIKVAAASGLVALDPSLASQYIDKIDLKSLNFEQFMTFYPYILKSKDEKYLPILLDKVIYYPLYPEQYQAPIKEGFNWLMSTDNTELTKKAAKTLGNVFGWFSEDEKKLLRKVSEDGLKIKEDLLKKNPNSESIKAQIDLLKNIKW
nr:M1 family metallopeptidase [uncultured Capnocytophaga sp.]